MKTNYFSLPTKTGIFYNILIYFWLIFAVVGCLFIISSCDKDSDDEHDSELVDPGSGNGGSQSSYSLKQLQGHWVEEDEWKIQQAEIKSIQGNMPSSILMGAVSDVEGFYIDASASRAYDLYIEATTSKYSNNDVAGNKIIASWKCTDGVTVYVMNISGSRNNGVCRMSGDSSFYYNGTTYSILSTSRMQSPYGRTYIKVSL